jgi:hypothetical protein
VTLPAGLCVDPGSGAVADPVATPLLRDVMQAVIDRFDAHPTLTPPCSWGLVSGAQMAVDRGAFAGDGCAGLLTGRLVSIAPTGAPPGYEGLPHRMVPNAWSVAVEVGVWRPAGTVTDTPDGPILPALEDVQAEAELAALDAAVVRAALLGWADEVDVPVVLGAFIPWGPDGGVVGGATVATFDVI